MGASERAGVAANDSGPEKTHAMGGGSMSIVSGFGGCGNANWRDIPPFLRKVGAA